MDKNKYHHEISEDHLIEQMINTTNPVTKSSIRNCLKARHTDDENQTPTPVDFDETKKYWWS